MEQKEFRVTIPSIEEMHEVNDYLTHYALKRSTVTDFAMVNGASSVDYFLGKNKYLNLGPTWTRNVGNKDALKITVAEQGLTRRGFTTTECQVEDASISVMPRFQNPKAQGFGWTNLKDNRVLTINGKIAYWPQRHIATFVDKIRNRFPDRTETDQNFMGHKCYFNQGKNYVVIPQTANKAKGLNLFDDQSLEYLHFADGQLCYPCDMPKYIKRPAYCFALEPIRVMPCDDGSIQCLDALFPSAIGTNFMALQKLNGTPGKKFNLDSFPLGIYLNNEFIASLQKSTELIVEQTNKKLSELNLSHLRELRKVEQNTAREREI